MARRLRLLASVSLAVVPILGFTATPAAADSLFQGQTVATAVHVTITQVPASSIITASLIDDAFSYVSSAYDSSGGSEAQAATVFPGNLVVQGPGLLCSQLFPCPTSPPDYPLLADASYPRSTTAQATANQQQLGSGPFVVTPAGATAQAQQNSNTGQTTTGQVALLTGTPVAVTVGGSSAETNMQSSGSNLLAHVESTVTDVTVAGIVNIGSIATTDDVTMKPGAKPVDSPHILISDVTVAGQKATIDETGIHVAGANGPALGQRLASNGIAIKTIGVTKTDAVDAARSEATGVEVDFSAPVSGTPYIPNPLPSPFDAIPGVNANGTYVGRITLGAVGTAAATEIEPTFSLGGFPLAATTATPPAVAAAPPAGGGLLQQLAGTPPAAPAVAPQTTTFRVALDAFSLGDLYAVLALGTVGLFVGWRLLPLLRRRRAAART